MGLKDRPRESQTWPMAGERAPITWIFFFRPHLDYPSYRRPLCNNDDVDEYETVKSECAEPLILSDYVFFPPTKHKEAVFVLRRGGNMGLELLESKLVLGAPGACSAAPQRQPSSRMSENLTLTEGCSYI